MIRALAWFLAFLVVSCWPTACSQPVGRINYTVDEPEAQDTALALQNRLQRSLDSVDSIPPGCNRDSAGLNCPDLKPPRAP